MLSVVKEHREYRTRPGADQVTFVTWITRRWTLPYRTLRGCMTTCWEVERTSRLTAALPRASLGYSQKPSKRCARTGRSCGGPSVFSRSRASASSWTSGRACRPRTTCMRSLTRSTRTRRSSTSTTIRSWFPTETPCSPSRSRSSSSRPTSVSRRTCWACRPSAGISTSPSRSRLSSSRSCTLCPMRRTRRGSSPPSRMRSAPAVFS